MRWIAGGNGEKNQLGLACGIREPAVVLRGKRADVARFDEVHMPQQIVGVMRGLRIGRGRNFCGLFAVAMMQERSRCVWVLARIADRVAGEQVEQARCVAGLGTDEQQAVGCDRFVIATVRKELAVGGGKFFGELQRAADELIETATEGGHARAQDAVVHAGGAIRSWLARV